MGICGRTAAPASTSMPAHAFALFLFIRARRSLFSSANAAACSSITASVLAACSATAFSSFCLSCCARSTLPKKSLAGTLRILNHTGKMTRGSLQGSLPSHINVRVPLPIYMNIIRLLLFGSFILCSFVPLVYFVVYYMPTPHFQVSKTCTAACTGSRHIGQFCLSVTHWTAQMPHTQRWPHGARACVFFPAKHTEHSSASS